MIPGATIFLYLLPLAAAPVVFHLLMRRRRRRIYFSTKMFFDRVHPRLTIYRRLRELLLLAARMLLIALLLLALARLTVTGIGNVLGMGGKQAVVVVIDNSGSMAGQVKGGEKTKLKTAIEGARALLTNVEEGAKTGIVPLVSDPKLGQWGGITAERQAPLDFLDNVQATEAAGDPAKAIEQAVALLREAGPAGGGSIHVFTDLQETEWKEQQINTKDVGNNVRVVFHRVPTAPAELPNVCLTQAKTSARRILPRQPYQVELLLRNDGDEDLDIRVNMQDQNLADVNRKNIAIAAGAKKRVKLGFQSQSPGAHWIRVWLEGDGFAGDNRASISYVCEQRGDIYFVGEQNTADFGLLPLAFSPHGDGRYTSLVPGFCPLGNLQERIEQKKPILVVLKWSDACALDEKTEDLLQQYVKEGGNLLVVPAVAGEKPRGDSPAWLGATPGKMNVLPQAAPLLVQSNGSEFWSDLRGPDGRVRFGGAYASRYYPLSLEEDARYEPLLSTGDDHTVLAIRSLGEGQITVSGMAFAGSGRGVPQWSTLPKKKAFLVMAQPMALGAVSSLVNENIFLVAGGAPASLPGKEDEVIITTLVGDQVDWSGPRDQVPELVREGGYIVRMGKRETCLSVMPSDTEGGTAFIEGPEVASMAGISHAVRELSDEEYFRDELENSNAGMELYIPLLLFAIAAFMSEGLLGSPSPWRQKRSAGGQQQKGREEPGTAREAISGGEVTS